MTGRHEVSDTVNCLVNNNIFYSRYISLSTQTLLNKKSPLTMRYIYVTFTAAQSSFPLTVG